MKNIFDEWEGNHRCPVYGLRAGAGWNSATKAVLCVIDILMPALRDRADEILVVSCDHLELPDWARSVPNYVFVEYRKEESQLNQCVKSEEFGTVASGIQVLLGENVLLRLGDLVTTYESVFEPRNPEAHEEINNFRVAGMVMATAHAVINQPERRAHIFLRWDMATETKVAPNHHALSM